MFSKNCFPGYDIKSGLFPNMYIAALLDEPSNVDKLELEKFHANEACFNNFASEKLHTNEAAASFDDETASTLLIN
ncbi:10911_t:CDS:2 [Diversispora eburnea]|uniref:10911_t:CDS:1 n=1 Tax=Diversispora eburnea TaxID=1213867 RepID=A0A9N8V3K4_9GLOM|nr:10911_t:CDS:2 [Diversispora eburnea]